MKSLVLCISRGTSTKTIRTLNCETLIILFGGGTKRGQQKDINRAKELHAEYKLRKKEHSANKTANKRKT